MPEQVILTLNAGLSSLKFALFTAFSHPRRLWSGTIDRIGLPNAHFQTRNARKTGVLDLVTVGHRFVHGGPECVCPKRVTPALLERLIGALGGVDRAVFTGGIGEKSAGIYGRNSAGLGYFGIDLDSLANKSGITAISRPGARVAVEARTTDAEMMIACHVASLLNAGRVPHPAMMED